MAMMQQQLNCMVACSSAPHSLLSSICSQPNTSTSSRNGRFLFSGFGSSKVSLIRVGKKAASVRCKPLEVMAAVALPNLKAADFQHPLDKQNTTFLRAIPGLNEIGKVLLGPVAEQVMLLENIATSILVSEKQLPSLHRLMVEAANILNLEAPDLYVRQNPVPNAYTLAIAGRKPFVVIHTSIVELLKPAELQAVIAHELGHLKCDHGIWLTFANILALSAYSLPGLGGLIARNAEDQLLRWLRAAELTCDRAALLVAQDPNVVISLLMKLTGGCPSMAEQLDLDEFLQQARSYDEAAASPLGWYLRNAQTRQLTHPLPVLRAREIDKWAKSTQYKSLIANAEISTMAVQRTINGKLSASIK
ncbi:hypothetical protein O6H91_11G028800 [Diphasiastrum complanatum]|uniref:Uncharacterized protein n=2 Tax=Diphasiastrum complanatum TaxID=34168 RepID=A0ACC2C8I2_DIPCM|nr:hypothetical protein O6H91_11G028300 [Diphasiastrum complanatum]KAJ7537942.1 hypothetical protein O6H91_11G028800 [Diphasiastrum complanatum]